MRIRSWCRRSAGSTALLTLLTLLVVVGAMSPASAAAAELGPAPRYDAPQELPAGPSPQRAADVLTLTLTRAEVVQLYQDSYVPGGSVAPAWTGAVAGCVAGTTALAHQQAVIDRVNYYRSLVSLPPVALLGDPPAAQSQASALMMSANNSLSHAPPTNWTCYTADGATAAGKSNLALGAYGVEAVDLYMDDFGASNTAVGHRRWVLYPPRASMATGDVTGSGSNWAANDLYVFGPLGTRPATPAGVAWPPAGFVPYQNLPSGSNRWSFSYPGAGFSGATVTVTGPGGPLSVALETIATGYGDNTIVFLPTGVSSAKPAADTTYGVVVSGITGTGVPSSVSYNVTVIDPDSTPSTAPTVQFSLAASGGAEAATPAQLTVSLSEASSQTVTVDYATGDGTAVAGSDYTASSGTLTFDPEVTTRTIPVTILDDAAVEPDETFTVTLSSPVNANLGPARKHTYTIGNDDCAIRLSAAAYAVGEQVPQVTITAQRIGSGSGAAGAEYATTPGTATSPEDFGGSTGTLSWAGGDTTAKTFTVPIVNDGADEPDETFTVSLSALTGCATLGPPASAVVTVTDNDAPPAVLFGAATSSGAESATPAAIGVKLSAASGRTVTVRYATANGTALAGSDYTASAGTLIFAPGETLQTLEVPITGDTALEPNETFTVALSAPANATLGAVPRHTRTIVNDDFRGTIRLGAATYGAGEAGPTVTLMATRTGGSSGIVGVSFATANGTALAGKDYTAAAGKLAWEDGDTKGKPITVTLLDDAIDEVDEQFTVRLLAPTGGATLGLPYAATVTLVDDEAVPEVQFVQNSSSGAESTTPASLAVALSRASSRTVTVKYAIAGGIAVGLATAGADYLGTGGTLTFSPGQTSKAIAVPIVNNSTAEVDENLTVTLVSAVNAVVGLESAHVYTIQDEDTNGAIRLAAAAYTVSEAGRAVTLTAMRLGGSIGEVSVLCATADGTAFAGSEYTAVSKTVTWLDHDRANKTCTVPITDDLLDEPNKTFTVSLSAPAGGAVLGAPASAKVTIADNDPAPTVRFSLTASTVDETAGTTTVGVTLSAPSERTVTVKYATANGSAAAGSDYLAAAGTLSFGPKETSGTITLSILDDAAVEPNQTFWLRLSAPVNAVLGAPYAHLVTIASDDDPAADRAAPGERPAGTAGTAPAAANDIAGDGRSDLGGTASVPVVGDFDGDGRADRGSFLPEAGTWRIVLSSGGERSVELGGPGAVPVVGDFDGDGLADCGVYLSETGAWEIVPSSGGGRSVVLGDPGGVPVVGDFDGDGIADPGCYFPAEGRWLVIGSASGRWQVQPGGE